MRLVVSTTLILALLAACGQRSADPDSAADTGAAQEASGDAAAAADAAATAKADAEAAREQLKVEAAIEARMADYRARLLPLLARDYAGQCSAMNGKPVADTIRFSADGVVSARDVTLNLKGDKARIALSRSIRDGKVVMGAAEALNHGPEWTLMLMGAPKNSATLTTEGNVLGCESVPATDALNDKALYPQVASLFVAGTNTLTCVGGESMAPSKLEIKASADGVAIGERRFAFAAIKDESVRFDASSTTLTYIAGLTDGYTVSISLNGEGKIGDAVIGGNDTTVVCMGDR